MDGIACVAITGLFSDDALQSFRKRESTMDGIIYLVVDLVVIVMAVLSLLGLH